MNDLTHDVSQDEKTWGLIAHLSSLSGLLVPFGTILGPLIVWLVKKDTMPFASAHAKEALNFNITVFLAIVVSGILTVILIGFLMMLAVGIAWIVLTIMAALKANAGEEYRYPFTLRLVS